MTQEIIKSVQDIESLAETALRSGLMGISNSSQAVMKILAGREMGLGAFASLSGIHIIQEKPVLGANLMAAAIKSSARYDYRMVEFNSKACEIMFLQKVGGNWVELGTSRFTMDDAATAGLLDKKNKDGSDNNWKKYPQNMLFARAISNGVRWYTPDLFSGNAVYTPDELDDNAIAGEWAAASEKLPDPEQVTLQKLMQEYGAEAVMAANDGRVPGDDPAELAKLAEKLATEVGSAV